MFIPILTVKPNKKLKLKILHDGEGPVRLAVLYVDRPCYAVKSIELDCEKTLNVVFAYMSKHVS